MRQSKISTHDWYNRDHHHTDATFRNPWPLSPATEEDDNIGFGTFLRTQFFGEKDQSPAGLTTLSPSSLSGSVDSEAARLTWLGHSTVLLQFAGLTILTDPVWAKRVGPFELAGPKRQVAPPLSREDLPPVDVVLLSHNHYDHLDPKFLRFLIRRDDPKIFVPLGVDRYLPKGTNVSVFDWNQVIEIEGFRFHCLPSRHFSGRTLTDRNKSLWSSWYIEPVTGKAPSIYYAGDTGYAPHLKQIRERLGSPNVLLLPIGAYLPRSMMRPVHLNPPESVQAVMDLDPQLVIPIHWGTYDLALEPLDEPPKALLAQAEIQGCPAEIQVLECGEIVLCSS